MSGHKYSRCSSKVQHMTKEDAETAVASFVLRFGRKDNKSMSSFFCRQCGYWHIGHRKAEERYKGIGAGETN